MMMKTYGEDKDAFIFGNKDKLWIVWKQPGSGYILVEAKDYILKGMKIDHNIGFGEVCDTFGGRLLDMQPPSPIKIELELLCEPKKFIEEFSENDDLSPDKFYSIPELIKLSKIITKKMRKIKEVK